MQQIIDRIAEEYRKQEEQQLLDDIIDIYEHKYKNYDEYYKNKVPLGCEGYVPILTYDTFYYLMEKKDE